MTQVLSFASTPIHDTPPHLLMDLDRAVGLAGPRGALPPRRSQSPAGSDFGRKRSTSITSAEAAHGFYEQLTMGASSPAAMKPETSREAICLCAPTPKIPRPRNAFILYRQHHQSQVTADNPKLSNPEISKIIGEKWKHEIEDVKDNWKKLAEEEKQRHQHQYPNYRYQPRRGSKAHGTWPNSSAGDESGRCIKCNGRTIAGPRTPSTPVVTPPSVSIGPHGQPLAPRLDTSSTPRRLSMELSPVHTLPFPHQQLPPVRAFEEDPNSPDSKRRRANVAGNYHAVSRLQGAFGDASVETMRTSPEIGPYLPIRPYPTSLPELSSIPRSHSGPMPPPPRPPGTSPWAELETTRRHSGFDESLRLPPLQTAVSPSPVRTHSMDIRQPMRPSPVFALANAPQEKRPETTEDAIKSMPFKRKLAALSRISRLLSARSGGNNPSSVDNRGAIVAVEGPNPQILYPVGQAVEKALRACDDIFLRSWTADLKSEGAKAAQGVSTPRKCNSKTEFSEYLRTMISWQEKAEQIVAHVRGETDGSSASGARQNDTTDASASQGSSKATENVRETELQTPNSHVRVALMKEGYSLTLSDKFASKTPILDMYSPQDHWHWMASMWRGTPNADFVIYVQPTDDEEIKKTGSIEFSKRMGLIVVKISNGTAIDEVTERRMAYELIEWVREGTFRTVLPSNWRDD